MPYEAKTALGTTNGDPRSYEHPETRNHRHCRNKRWISPKSSAQESWRVKAEPGRDETCERKP